MIKSRTSIGYSIYSLRNWIYRRQYSSRLSSVSIWKHKSYLIISILFYRVLWVFKNTSKTVCWITRIFRSYSYIIIYCSWWRMFILKITINYSISYNFLTISSNRNLVVYSYYFALRKSFIRFSWLIIIQISCSLI